tara:strand:+ start:6841 stop:7287 length:447 start_codon:yes stop_codon:yes gene_type:complete
MYRKKVKSYRNNKKFKKDLKYGLTNEFIIKEKIEKIFNIEFEKTKKYDNFDFYSPKNNIYVELKTRRINHNRYNSMFFSKSKLNFINKNPNNTFYFIYSCLDGDYFWKYEKDKIFMSYGGRTDRGKDERYELCNVNVELLQKLTDMNL